MPRVFEMYNSTRTSLSILLLFQKTARYSYGTFVDKIAVRNSLLLIAALCSHVTGTQKIKRGSPQPVEIRLLRFVIHFLMPVIATWFTFKCRQVWDLGYRPVLEYTVTTMASVGRIKWRPQRMHHIASCALVIDSVIHVWDVRRPYIPHASFNDHKDITTGIAWRGCPDVLLSTSKVWSN